MMKKVLALCIFILGFNLISINATSGPENVIAEVGSINIENLSVDGYTLLTTNIDFNEAGEYNLTYRNGNKYLYRKLVLYNASDYKYSKNITISEKTFEKEEGKEIVKVMFYDQYSFFMVSNYDKYGIIECYVENELSWKKEIVKEGKTQITDFARTENGIIIAYNTIIEEQYDIGILEMGYNGTILREHLIEGSKDDLASTIYVYNNYIYLTGTTKSSDGYFERSFYLNSTQVFVTCMTYDEFSKFGMYWCGNDGNNSILSTEYEYRRIIVKASLDGHGVYGTSNGGQKGTYIFVFDFDIFEIYDYTNFQNINCDYTSKVCTLDDCYGLIERKENTFVLHTFTNDMFINNNVFSVDAAVYNYDIVDYEIINYYDFAELVIYYQSKTDGSRKYRVYQVNSSIDLKLECNSNNTYIGRNFYYYELGDKLIGKVVFSIDSDKKNYFSNGYYTSKDIYINDYKLNSKVLKYPDVKDYGLYPTVNWNELYGIKLFYNSFVKYNLECNVEDDEIYDLGYQLKYNANGYLNNKRIDENYIINEPGRYVLKLTGDGVEDKIIIFEVDDLMKKYQSYDVINYDKDITVDKNLNDESVSTKFVNDSAKNLEEEKPNYLLIGLIASGFLGIVIAIVTKKIVIKVKYLAVLLICFYLFPIHVKAASLEVIVQEAEVEVIDKKGEYQIQTIDNEYYLQYQNERIMLQGENIKLDEYNQKGYVTYYKDGYLWIEVYDGTNIVKKAKAINNVMSDIFDVQIHDGKIYLLGSTNVFKDNNISQKYSKKRYLNNMCGVIIILNDNLELINLEVYGGGNNDYFRDLYVDEYIYVVGTRDKQSGGDFGNYGTQDNTYVAKIGLDLSIQNYYIHDELYGEYHIEFLNGQLYTIFDKTVNQYDDNLQSVKRYYLSTNNVVIDSFNNIYDFYEGGYSVISLDKKVKEDYKCDNLVGEYTIRKLDDCLFYSGEDKKFINIIDSSMINEYILYYDDLSISYPVRDLFKEYSPRVECDYYFNKMISGQYPYRLVYDISGYEYIREVIVDVEEEVNIVDGRIYPVGYHLFFKGNAYLNEEIIANNYAVYSCGNYELKIVDFNNNVNTYHFQIADSQIEFTDLLRSGKMSFKNKQEVVLKLPIDNWNNDYELDHCIINNNEYYNCYVHEDILEINLGHLEIGVYDYNIDGIKFYCCDNIIYQPINHHYSIEIYNDDIYCNLVSIDDNKLTYDIIDDYRLARNLLIKTICNNVEKDYLYSLGTQSICLDELLDGDYVTTEVYLVYDINKTNQYIELFTANGNTKRGNWIIKTHYIDEDTKTLSIELSDGLIDNLDNIKVNGIVKYEGSRVDIKAIIVSSIIVLVVFFSISYGIISLIRKYKYNFKY